MYRTPVKYENYSASGVDYIGFGMRIVIPGKTIGDDGITINVPTEHATEITAAIQAIRPAVKATAGVSFEDGIYPAYAPFIKDNLTATTNPGVTDDTTKGYTKGSRWINTSANPKEAYVCLDATEGAAVWANTTLTAAELGTAAFQAATAFAPFVKNNLVATTAPAVTDDVTDGYSKGSLWIDTAASPKKIYICLDPDDGAAVWDSYDPTGTAAAAVTAHAALTTGVHGLGG